MTQETIFHIHEKTHQNHTCAEIVPIFSNLDQTQLLKISELIHHQSFQKGNVVIDPETQELIILNQGHLKLYQLSSTGKEQLLRVLGPGDFEGEKVLFGAKTPDAYAEALTDGTACVIYKRDFQALLLKYPAISLKLLQESAEKLAALERQTSYLSADSIEQRLVSYLMDLYEAQQQVQFVLPMKLKELAAYIGTTPETLSRTFKALRQANLIQKDRRKITVLDPDKLAAQL
ncbi:Crp/Fnr family transcriptional regulator [Agrilactobacillus fermenti]|uniref:Crp/Fnr family transcriptional regulator n=1 Tax=Agrilactobacillus fermenti TaxID=2586909 RepID=UPI003A5BDAB5